MSVWVRIPSEAQHGDECMRDVIVEVAPLGIRNVNKGNVN